MSVTAPDRASAHGSPLDDPLRAEQMKQAEELLFSGPAQSGFAKALFRGEFRSDVIFPYPELPPTSVPSSTRPSAVSASSPTRDRRRRRSTARPISRSRSLKDWADWASWG